MNDSSMRRFHAKLEDLLNRIAGQWFAEVDSLDGRPDKVRLLVAQRREVRELLIESLASHGVGP